MTAYYFDMDGVLANFHKAYATNKGTALQRKAMANLEPFEENVNLVRNMIKAGLKVYILTKAANEAGKLGKRPFQYPQVSSKPHPSCLQRKED